METLPGIVDSQSTYAPLPPGISRTLNGAAPDSPSCSMMAPCAFYRGGTITEVLRE
jgi:hypothetical protein